MQREREGEFCRVASRKVVSQKRFLAKLRGICGGGSKQSWPPPTLECECSPVQPIQSKPTMTLYTCSCHFYIQLLQKQLEQLNSRQILYGRFPQFRRVKSSSKTSLAKFIVGEFCTYSSQIYQLQSIKHLCDLFLRSAFSLWRLEFTIVLK